MFTDVMTFAVLSCSTPRELKKKKKIASRLFSFKSLILNLNKSYTPWREGPDGRQIQYQNYIGPLH